MTTYNITSNLVSYEDDCFFGAISVPISTKIRQLSVYNQLCITPNSVYRIPSPGVVRDLLSKRHTAPFTTVISTAEKATDTILSEIPDLKIKERQTIRVIKIIDEYLEKEKDSMIEPLTLKDSIIRMMSRVGYKKIQAVTDEELRLRIQKIIFIEKLSTMIDKSNESEVRTFEEAASRRSFFK